jgi:uncharacterized protein YdeI (YjbR/CyaY-like superfamily)
MKPRFFKTPAEFRSWLAAHHADATELLVGFYKRVSGRPSMTWPESVDEALCFGWIDGVRRRIDDERYSIRFTPRRRGSIWSAVNIARVAALRRAGRMHPAGIRTFELRDPAKTAQYSFERPAVPLPLVYERQLRANAAAWAYFSAAPPFYRRVATHWIISAKHEATRQRRLARLIEQSAKGERILP